MLPRCDHTLCPRPLTFDDNDLTTNDGFPRYEESWVDRNLRQAGTLDDTDNELAIFGGRGAAVHWNSATRAPCIGLQ
jgi:hypothetical protein